MVHTSWLQHLPAAGRYYRQCLPIFPTLIEQFNLERFDLVISSSHCAAKAVVAGPRALHICYCHTPMRYAWDQFEAYFGRERVGAVAHAVARRVMARMARWDRSTADRVDRFITNSRHVARRILTYYNRQASVVYPPVDTAFFCPGEPVHSPRQSCLIVSALVPYKRIDVAIEACRLVGVPLAIVGKGPERAHLERLANDSGADVSFLGHLSDEAVRDEYRRAAAVLMPGEEDFGLVPLEAQACGRPVVALARGGVLESVIDNRTGVFVGEPTPRAFADGIQSALARTFDSGEIRRHAERFGRARFGDEIESLVDETVREKGHRTW